MYKLGCYQTVEVVSISEIGVLFTFLKGSEEAEAFEKERMSNKFDPKNVLDEDDELEGFEDVEVDFEDEGDTDLFEKRAGQKDILLPNKNVSREYQIGDTEKLFIFRDSEDRLVGTTKRPKITMYKLATLEVNQVNQIGAFLDWGLEKDLFLPFREQTIEVQTGEKYMVMLYIDKSDRLCATTKIYKHLKTDAPYVVDDAITGTVYQKNDDMGVFVAIDSKYHGLIPLREAFGDLEIGSKINGFVLAIREDGKIDITVRGRAYMNLDNDSKLILGKINDNEGILMMNDKTDPEEIKRVFGFSKRAFKRAVGGLLKAGTIEFIDGGMKLK
ncbi:MAG: S1-like domain-containing RNA-binding protein [Acidaminobacteraceae bacterium]